jgi:P27 family predicted phage terminase small subunit
LRKNKLFRESKLKIPQVPKNLCSEARALWRDIHNDFEVGADAREILRVGCMSLTRYLEAKEILDREGLTFKTASGQVKKHPVCSVEKDSLTSFLQAMRLLGLEFEQPKPKGPGRPPG